MSRLPSGLAEFDPAAMSRSTMLACLADAEATVLAQLGGIAGNGEPQ